jgi:hypothetical protein
MAGLLMVLPTLAAKSLWNVTERFVTGLDLRERGKRG